MQINDLQPMTGNPVRHGSDMERDFSEHADPDLLYGVPAIAKHLGLGDRQARHLVDKGSLPTFTLPGNRTICARRSSLNAWLAEREAAARQQAQS